MRCVLHTVISNVHIVGCSQGQVSPYGLLFEGGRGHVEIQISQCWGFYLDTGEPSGMMVNVQVSGKAACVVLAGVPSAATAGAPTCTQMYHRNTLRLPGKAACRT